MSLPPPPAGALDTTAGDRTGRPRAVAMHPSTHRRSVHPARLLDPVDGRGASRRRAFQRCSAVVATLMLGAGQCDPAAPATNDAGPTAALAATSAAAPAAPAPATPAAAPVATTTLAPTHPASGGAEVPAPVAPVPGPDGTAEQGRCTQFEALLAEHAPPSGWDVTRMSRIAWRESNCWPDIRSRTSDTGLLQINDINLEFLRRELGEPVDRFTLTDPVQNVRAAAALCTYWARNGATCYQPWQATDR